MQMLYAHVHFHITWTENEESYLILIQRKFNKSISLMQKLIAFNLHLR